MRMLVATIVVLLSLAVQASAHGGCGYRGPAGEVPPGFGPGSLGPAFSGAKWGDWWLEHAGEFLSPSPAAEASGVSDGVRADAADAVMSLLDARLSRDDHARVVLTLGTPGLGRAALASGAGDLWLALLTDPDEKALVRAAAALSLVRAGSSRPDTLVALERALVHRAGPDRLRAAAALGLGLLARDPDDGRRRRILAALEAAADDETAAVAIAARRALGLTRVPDRIPGLLARARRGDDDLLIAAALEAAVLASTGFTDDDVLRALIEAAGEGGPRTRRAAAEGLGRMGPGLRGTRRVACLRTLDDLLGSSEAPVAAAALVSFGRIGAEAALPGERVAIRFRLEAALAKGKKDRRPYAALALGVMGRAEGAMPPERSSIVRALIAGLGDEELSARDRGAAAVALGLVGDQGAEPILLDVLGGDHDQGLRAAAALAVGLAGATSDAGAIRAAIDQRKCPDLRLRAASAAGLLGVGEAASRMRDDPATSPSRDLAFGRIGDPSALGRLLDVVRDASAGGPARVAAAVALGDLLDGRADVPRTGLSSALGSSDGIAVLRDLVDLL